MGPESHTTPRTPGHNRRTLCGTFSAAITTRWNGVDTQVGKLTYDISATFAGSDDLNAHFVVLSYVA